MKQLTLKDIAKYLPYDLRARHSIRDIVDKLTFENIRFALSDNCKPILRPLSQLVGEIEHNGERFVPIVELAKVYNTAHDWDDPKKLKNEWFGAFAKNNLEDSPLMSFLYSKKLNFFQGSLGVVRDQEQLFQKLYEWHFWTGDQSFFQQGLLIEKQ